MSNNWFFLYHFVNVKYQLENLVGTNVFKINQGTTEQLRMTFFHHSGYVSIGFPDRLHHGP